MLQEKGQQTAVESLEGNDVLLLDVREGGTCATKGVEERKGLTCFNDRKKETSRFQAATRVVR